MNKKLRIGFIIIVIVSLVVYHQIFYAIFAFGDAPSYMVDQTKALHKCISEGRILQAYFFNIMYGLQSVKGLIVFRVLSLLTWLFNVYSFMLIFQRIQNGKINSSQILFVITFSFILIFNLSTSLFIGWTACAQAGLGFCSGLWSGYYFVKAQTLYSKERYYKLGLSLALMVVAFCLYQTMSLVFLLPLYLVFSYVKTKPWDILKEGLLAYAFGLVSYMLFFKLTLKIYDLEASSRSKITTDIIGKLNFFLDEALMNASKPIFFKKEYETLPLLVIGIILFGFVVVPFIKKVNINRILLNIISVIIFVVFSYYLSLVTVENWASSRTLIVLSLMIALVFCDVIFNRLNYSILIKICLALILICVIPIRSYKNFNSYFVNPLVHEYGAVYDALNKNHSSLMLIRSNWNSFEDRFDIYAQYDEYGIPSTFISWTVKPLTQHIMAEKFNNYALNQSNIVVKEYGYIPTEEDLKKYKVINFHEIIK